MDVDIRVPVFYDVGNAVGALAGKIIHRTEVLIRPVAAGKAEYFVFSKIGKEVFEDYEKALKYGLELSYRLVLEYMDGYDLEMDDIKFDIKQHDIGGIGKNPLETRLVGIGVGMAGKLE